MTSTKNREITIFKIREHFRFLNPLNLLLKKIIDFSGLLALRQLLSDEKARILHTIKTKNPKSIYELAKI
jgi:hypothetical protein